jgi:hypothetical protein
MARPYQLNVTPPEETLDLLDKCVEKFGSRHSNARNRVSIAAEVMQQFLPVWVYLMERRDADLIEKLESLGGGSLNEMQAAVDRIMGKAQPATNTPSRRASRG